MRFSNRVLFILALSLAAASGPALAEWELDNAESSLSFVTVKAADLGEAHRFDSLSGSVSESGMVEVVIDLASVDTLIPIRDQRMRDILFEVSRFPTATLTAAIDAEQLSSLPQGGAATTSVAGELALKGQTFPVTLDVMAARLSGDRLLVASRKPVIVSAANLGLAEAVEQLREIAGLPSISKAVPVSFVLVFRNEG